MKRETNLFEQFCSFENLFNAAYKNQRGKRYKDSTTQFNFNLENNLLRLRQDLLNDTYTPEPYNSFMIFEPKQRLISAATYRDRVIHHAVCNIIAPIFERTFIHDLYSNRKEKGSHKAVDRFQEACRLNTYVLKCDVSKYFASMDKEVLFCLVTRKIKDKRLLAVIRQIIDSYESPGNSSKGIPLGNLTSQLFANLYLSPLDHYLKETLHCRYYIRYTDDFVVFDNDKHQLSLIKKSLCDFLRDYQLDLNLLKSHVHRTIDGVEFLGYRIFLSHRLIKKANVKRWKKKLRKYQQLYAENRLAVQPLLQSLKSWNAHAEHADSYKLRERLYAEYTFLRAESKPLCLSEYR
jgi:retron-type reverse transcriptase